MKVRNIIVIALAFLFISLIFNFTLWRDLFVYTPQKIALNDSIPNEFLTETSYQNILKLKNPFITDKILYPFETNFSFNDPIITNSIYLFFLRPFLNIHQSSLLIVLINIFLANIFMFFVLKKLKIKTFAAFISACIFGFTPFISQRLLSGHYTYTTIYLFPLLFLTIHSFIFSKTFTKKTIYSSLSGVVLAFTAMTNVFYFLSQLLTLLFFTFYYLFLDFRTLKNFITKNYKYILISISTTITLLIPWLIQVVAVYSSQTPVNTRSFYGAIDLSADVFSYFVPNDLNPFYKQIILNLANTPLYISEYSKFFFNNRLSFAYPGILIILAYVYFLFYKKDSFSKLKKQIKPFFYSSLFFVILSLGPFLKVFGIWYITLEENIPVVIPLPFLLLHYLPGFDMVRAPMRFAPIFVFFATIVFAFIFEFISKKYSKKTLLLSLIVFLIFFADQFYLIKNEIYKKIPYKAYIKIKSDPVRLTVLEIPFTVRDGLRYKGFVFATSPMTGSLIHGKPVMGGYLSRIDAKVFDYYQNLPFISFILDIIDKGNYNPLKEKPREPKVYPYNKSLELVSDELKNLNIKYILLKNDEKYTKVISNIIFQVGFKKIMTDSDYDLFIK